jgi:competence ComEA-like helix-hairpin-helix protein
VAPNSPETEGEDDGGGGILGRTVGAILGTGSGHEGSEEEGHEGAVTQDEPERGRVETVAAGDQLDLNSATFEDLRELGFSVTQATRVITYRERQNGFKSVDDLADVPGMPGEFLTEVRNRLTL